MPKPLPIKDIVLGPFAESFCFLYKYKDGGYFHFSFKRTAEVTVAEVNDPDITIYKMAQHHVTRIRHFRLDDLTGSLEIFEGPKIDVRLADNALKLVPIPDVRMIPPTCQGPCEPYEIECQPATIADCVDAGEGPRLVCLDNAVRRNPSNE